MPSTDRCIHLCTVYLFIYLFTTPFILERRWEAFTGYAIHTACTTIVSWTHCEKDIREAATYTIASQASRATTCEGFRRRCAK